jgi:hypothetical protein
METRARSGVLYRNSHISGLRFNVNPKAFYTFFYNHARRFFPPWTNITVRVLSRAS